MISKQQQSGLESELVCKQGISFCPLVSMFCDILGENLHACPVEVITGQQVNICMTKQIEVNHTVP